MAGNLKGIARGVVAKIVLRPFQFLLNNVAVNHDLAAEIKRRTSAECAEFIMENARSALFFGTREELWDYVLPRVRESGLVTEFGVREAYSLNYFAKRLPNGTLHGFDSFEGIHVDWAGTSAAKGTFDLGGKLPPVRSNVRLVKGWFDETLPRFLAEHPGPIALMHIDSDTYEAAKIVLDLAGDRLQPDSIVIFDDYLGYRGWLIGEHKAWTEFAERTGIKFEYIAFTPERMAHIVK